MAEDVDYFVQPETGVVGAVPKGQSLKAMQAGYTPASDQQITEFKARKAAKADPYGGVKAYGQALAEGVLPGLAGAVVAGVPGAIVGSLAPLSVLAMETIPSLTEIGRKVAPSLVEEESARIAEQKRLELAGEMSRFLTVPGLQQELGLRTQEAIKAEREARPGASLAGSISSFFVGPAVNKIFKFATTALVPEAAAKATLLADAKLAGAVDEVAQVNAANKAVRIAQGDLVAAQATRDAVRIAASERALENANLAKQVSVDQASKLQMALSAEGGKVPAELEPLLTDEVLTASKEAIKAGKRISAVQADRLLQATPFRPLSASNIVEKMQDATLTTPAVFSKVGTEISAAIESSALSRIRNLPGLSSRLAEIEARAAREADNLATGADKIVTAERLRKANENLATLETRQELVAKAIGLGLGRSAELMLFGAQGIANETALGDPALVAESAYATLGFDGGLGAVAGVGEALLPPTLRAGLRAARATGNKIKDAIGKVYPEIASFITGAEPETIRAVMDAKEDLAKKGLRRVIEEATPMPARPALPPEIVSPAPVPAVGKALAKSEVDAVAKDFRLALQDDVRQIAAPEPGGLLFDANTKWRKVQLRDLIDDHAAKVGTDGMRGALDDAISYVADVRDRIVSSAGLSLEPGQVIPQETAQKSAYLLNRVLQDVEKRLVAFAESSPSPTKIHEEIQGVADEIYDKVKSYGISSLELKSVDRQANAAYSGLRRRLVDLVTDSNVWGDAGALEAAWREDARMYYAAMENLEKMAPKGLIKLLKDKNGRKTILTIDSQKMRSAAQDLGSEKYTSFREALSDYFVARRRLVGNIESVADYVKANVGKQEIAKKLGATELAFNKAIDRSVQAASKEALRESQQVVRQSQMASYEAEKQARDALVNSLNQEYAAATATRQQQITEQINLLRSASSKGSLVSAIKFAVKAGAPVLGGATLGPLGAIGGAALSAASSPVTTAKTLAKLNKAMITVSDKVGGVANVLTGTGAVAVKTGEALGSFATRKKLDEEYKKVERRVRELAVDADALMDQQDAMLADMVDDAPTIADATKTVNATALQYLANVKPRPPANMPPMQLLTWEPVDADKRKFLRITDAVMNPLETLELAGKGALLPEQIDALNAVYPSLMAEARANLLERIEQTGKVPEKHRMMVSMILGKDIDGRMQASKIVPAQSVYGQQRQVDAQKQAQAQMPLTRAQRLNLAERAEYEGSARRNAQLK